MHVLNWGISAVLLFAVGATPQRESIVQAADRFVPDVNWRSSSVLAANLSCRGRQEQAILGTSQTEIVIAIFLDGTNRGPEILRYSTGMRDPKTASLRLESLDYDPQVKFGAAIPGFRRSNTCKGLRLNDGKTDAAHIYWNEDARGFADWVR